MKYVHRALRIVKRYKQELFILILSIATIMVFIPIFTYVYFARDLKNKDTIMNRKNTGVILLDRNDKPFFTFYQGRVKTNTPLAEIPDVLQQAIIVSEDKEFYTHKGFSLRGIIRSLYLDIRAQDVAYGGSTITQQLVKNVLLTSDKSFLRKYQELVLAQEIERRFSKDEILEMYLNSVYLGEGAFGVEEASLAYFGKNVTDINLAQASLLAAILPAPSRLSPVSGDYAQAKVRQKIVLQNLLSAGYITEAQKLQAQEQKLTFESAKENLSFDAPHFALMVRDELIDKYGEERISRSGFTVKTTLDVEWQRYAEQVVGQQVDRLARNQVTNGAAVVMDPKNGEVRALVGSKDWEDETFGKFNVTTATRSPGSAFKPLIYATALEDRLITPATILTDKPTTFEGNYKPQNYDRRFRGDVSTRRALANSLNVPAVAIMQRVGVPRALDEAKRLGITTLKEPSNYGLSLVLGTGEVKLLELTGVYSIFANKGEKNPTTLISEIKDKNGKNIFTYEPDPEEVLEPEVAYLISSILSDNQARAEAFGGALSISRPAAVKTGTGEDYKDALTMGYTPNLVVGVWVGNNDGSPMDRIAGSLGAAPIWRSLMERFSQGTPVEQFEVPSGVQRVSICKEKGLRLRTNVATTSAAIEYFISGTAPRRFCDVGGNPTPFPSDQQPQPTSQEPTSTPLPTSTPTAEVTPTSTPTAPTPTDSSILPTVAL